MMSPCGVNCDECKGFGITCNGCTNIEGRVYWAGFLELEVCPIYGCCVNEKNLSHCGECPELPCRIYYETQDPSTTKEEHEAGIRQRVENLNNFTNIIF